MRGILFPNSNVIFFAQEDDPTKVQPAKDPSLSPNPLASTYGGWTAVENSARALSEAANLLILPGRKMRGTGFSAGSDRAIRIGRNSFKVFGKPAWKRIRPLSPRIWTTS